MSAATSHPEPRSRAGLGDLPARLRNGPCRIAYMGASVTHQRDGYRPRLHKQLTESTGQEHQAVAAGFGAMGSITGLFLMDRFVVPNRPDLAFVEYVTSDAVGTTPFELLEASLEGIVGKLRAAGCEPCFLYLPRRDLDLRSSKVLEKYEEVASYHGVPSIDVATWLADETERGSIAADSVLRDLVHTSDAGSALVAEAVAGAFGMIATAAAPRHPPLRDDSLRRTRIVDATPALLGDGSRGATGLFRLAFPYVEIDSGNEFSFVPEGDLVGLLLAVGPRSGYIELEAAGERRAYLLWDEWCSYERLSSVIFAPVAPAGGRVKIRLVDRPVDRSRASHSIVEADAANPCLKLLGLLERT